MQASRERLLAFLFPAETDNWLAVLRIGLGLEVTLTPSLFETIGPIYFRERHANWRKRCCLWKAILSRDSGGLLLSRHTSACAKRRYCFWHGFVCLLLVAACLSESLPAYRRLPPGFYTCARPKAVGSCRTAWIIL